MQHDKDALGYAKHSAYLHGIVYLISLSLLDSRVIGPLPNQQRCLNLVSMVKGRDLLIECLIVLYIPYSLLQLLLHGGPVGGYRLEEG